MATTCSNVGGKFTLQNIVTKEFYYENSAVNVLGFNLSLGIGDDSSTLSLDITGDPLCDGNVTVRAPYIGDALLLKSLSGSFYFGGILNNISYDESTTGFKYTLKMTDPKRLLSNINVLLKSYYCQIYDCFGQTAKNFINAASARLSPI